MNTLDEALRTHPCYSEDAHHKFARMHLPVAPKCNIQCNYCNRKYDCSNESRPGVTSEVLTPQEAVDKVAMVKEKIPELKVVAIAGPGDPLANEETFETLRLVNERFPEMTLCVSTNGLALPKNAARLCSAGVRFLTVTMNALDTSISERIYEKVVWNGKKLTGREGVEILLKKQLEGIKECIKLGMMVKINIVLIPGINDEHIPEMVKTLEEMGVYIVNILPLIPVAGTPFQDRRSPTPEERKILADICSGSVKMMRHCRQCRADAIGMLDNDRSQEFVKNPSCGSGCGPKVGTSSAVAKNKIAIATDDGTNVRGFGNAGTYFIYTYAGSFSKIDDVRMNKGGAVYGGDHQKHIQNIIEKLGNVETVVVSEIGPGPLRTLNDLGKKVVIFKGNVSDAIDSLSKDY